MTADTPNILFVLADDLGWGDVGYHGSAIRTPNIDRLVSYGVELDRHYVCPVCTPTRAAFISGRYPSRFGVHATTPSNQPVLPDGYETIAAVMKHAGYDTGLFGKWHLGSDPKYSPNRFGFDASYGSLAGGVDPYNHRYKRGPYTRTWHRNGKLVDEAGHVTDLIVDEAVAWIESRTKPWFCYVPFTAVHTPIDAPSFWIDQYASEVYDDDPAKDQSFKRYAAYTSHMDYGIGRLIDSLKRMDQFADTVVVFASDNGISLNDPAEDTARYPGWHWDTPLRGSNLPLRGGKGQFYEGGIRTPAVIAWPGTLSPGSCDEPLFIADWLPTFTHLVGYTPAEDPEWDGRDIWDAISGSQTREKSPRTIYWNLRGKRFALRNGGWKVITDERLDPDAAELYDVTADPYETRDRAGEQPNRVRGLISQITEARKKDDTFKRPDVE